MSKNKNTILLFNTLSHQLEEFTPQEENHVRMYVCGVTVYDYCHIGHARAYVTFDMLRRTLELFGYKVTLVQNFTDIDDKIIKRTQEELKKDSINNEDLKKVTERFIQAYHEDMNQLKIKPATIYPRATEHISEMIAMITKLIEKGHAYTKEGDVFFSVPSFNEYGKLSKRTLEDSQGDFNQRELVLTQKQHENDFVLWKKAKEGEPSWESPWGQGRPGWHIECSAMSHRYLGPLFDIHGGGRDLIFPHHENEIAQTKCSQDEDCARFWIHNGFITTNSEKMSKSEGNFLTLRDILGKFSPEAIRLFFLKGHYRSPLEFSLEGLQEAQNSLDRITDFQDDVLIYQACQPNSQEDSLDYLTAFQSCLYNDLNTPDALAKLYDMISEISKKIQNNMTFNYQEILEQFQSMTSTLGIINSDRQLVSTTRPSNYVQTDRLMLLRKQARLQKDYLQADTIRDEILKAHPDGIIKDKKEDSFLLFTAPQEGLTKS